MSLVELVYAPQGQLPLHVNVPFVSGMTVADVLNQSDLFEQYPEARDCLLGIFSKRVSMDTALRPGDRVELYRPLLSDPKEKRRQRAVVAKKSLINRS